MTRPCTTHHDACDCREAAHTEEVARLRSALSAIAAEGDACTCHVRSWYGSGHDTACPITIARMALAASAAALLQPRTKRPANSLDRIADAMDRPIGGNQPRPPPSPAAPLPHPQRSPHRGCAGWSAWRRAAPPGPGRDPWGCHARCLPWGGWYAIGTGKRV